MFSNRWVWLSVSIIAVVISIYIDHTKIEWLWFQRSGSLLALAGGILSYRSVIRLGKDGVGGATPFIMTGKQIGYADNGNILIQNDERTQKAINENELDKKAGYIGAILIIVGTLVWGYGDLTGHIFGSTPTPTSQQAHTQQP